MISSAPHFCFMTTRATTIAPAIGSVTTVAWAALILGNASRQPSTAPIATMPEARAEAGARSSSNGPIDLGDSVLLLTQIRPSLGLLDLSCEPSGEVIL